METALLTSEIGDMTSVMALVNSSHMVVVEEIRTILGLKRSVKGSVTGMVSKLLTLTLLIIIF